MYAGSVKSDAAKSAAGAQAKAITNIKDYTQTQMDPALVNKQALQADTDRAKNQLALQGQIDPELLKQRTTSEQMLSSQLAGIGSSASDKVAAQAAAEAIAQTPGAAAGKQQLIQAALDNIKEGATLPPDVQAEIMQAGLQQSSGVTGGAPGGASATGTGGAASSILTRVLGTEGVNLQAQRQQQASQLLTAASNLDAQRQQILQGLFPKLQQQQMSNISGTSGILQQSNSMLPQAGLTGTQVASDWLARVGAVNALSSQKAQVQANGTLAQAQAQAQMIGSATSAGTALVGSPGVSSGLSSFFNTTPAATNTSAMGGGSGVGIGASGNFAA
jgi:hypothetical protein